MQEHQCFSETVIKVKEKCDPEFSVYEDCITRNPQEMERCTSEFQKFISCADRVAAKSTQSQHLCCRVSEGSPNVNVMENQGCLRRLLNLEINLFFKPNALLIFISILSCFAICIEHGYDAEKTQIEIGNTFHYSRHCYYIKNICQNFDCNEERTSQLYSRTLCTLGPLRYLEKPVTLR